MTAYVAINNVMVAINPFQNIPKVATISLKTSCLSHSLCFVVGFETALMLTKL